MWKLCARSSITNQTGNAPYNGSLVPSGFLRQPGQHVVLGETPEDRRGDVVEPGFDAAFDDARTALGVFAFDELAQAPARSRWLGHSPGPGKVAQQCKKILA